MLPITGPLTMGGNRKALTLAELVIILAILGTLAVIAVAKMQYSTLRRQKADTVARVIATNLRLTRRLAISNAADNVDGYGLHMAGGSPYSAYQIVNLDTDDVVDTYTIDSEITCTGGSSFEFGPLGNLLGGSDTEFSVSSEGKSFTVSVISATGAVKCTDN